MKANDQRYLLLFVFGAITLWNILATVAGMCELVGKHLAPTIFTLFINGIVLCAYLWKHNDKPQFADMVFSVAWAVSLVLTFVITFVGNAVMLGLEDKQENGFGFFLAASVTIVSVGSEIVVSRLTFLENSNPSSVDEVVDKSDSMVTESSSAVV